MSIAAQEEQHSSDVLPELAALSFGLLEGFEGNTSSLEPLEQLCEDNLVLVYSSFTENLIRLTTNCIQPGSFGLNVFLFLT